ncbi:hypothetical protein G6F42_021279 [Rhizopus arrhizus]|nr:hypothetical protein G6F42_021279 [Rhizopus arrhizus]
MPGHGDLQLTGSLGDVIKESAKLALTWVKSHAYALKIVTDENANLVEKHDIHIHVPGGAVPKDGPSAGVTLVSSLVSLFSGYHVPPTTAMTGEISLRGQVLPVGGIKEKVVSAHRAGIRKIILPFRNRKDVEQDVPEKLKDDIEFVFAKNIWDVLEAALVMNEREKWTTRVYESHLKKKKRASADSIPPTRTHSHKSTSVKRALTINPNTRHASVKGAANIRHQSIKPKRSSFEAGSAEHNFARAKGLPSEEDVNILFDNMLERRGIHDPNIKQSMKDWEVEKKWLMINQDHQAELLASGIRHSRLHEAAAERASLDISRLPSTQINRSTSSPLSKSASRQPRPSIDGPAPTKSISSPVNKSTTPTSLKKSQSNALRPINTNASTSISNMSPIQEHACISDIAQRQK